MGKTKVKINYPRMRAKIIKESKKTLPKLLKKLIVDDNILRGKSPVSGAGNYKAYSTSYKNQIRAGRYNKFNKKPKPVNLKLSGEMLEAFFVAYEGLKIRIGFKSKVAVVHNDTAEKLRRMLPTNPKERFNGSIMHQIKEHMLKVAIRAMKKR